MKILFIVHADNVVYGAGKSLYTLLKNLDEEIQFDLLVDRPYTRYEDENPAHRLSTVMAGRAGTITLMPLPFSWCYVGEEARPWHMKALQVVRNCIWRLSGGWGRVRRIIEAGEYDIIHLNSVVLWPLIRKKYPTIVHVRELMRTRGIQARRAKRAFEKARHLILIDPVQAPPLAGVSTPRTILQNPFDMSKVPNLDAAALKETYGIPEGKVVFTIAGRITEEKGVPFVVEAFLKANPENAVLFVPGVGIPAVVERCKTVAAGNPNVIFPGEIDEGERIFAVSDYLIRGEDFFALGRTVYEALYAGCGAIIPGDRTQNIDAIEEHERFAPQIHFYPPRNTAALGHSFKTLGPRPAAARQGLSNAGEYAQRLESIYRKIISSPSKGI